MKVTILLSTYNGAKYLKEQLESLYLQTYKNFDIIVRDDGSSDESYNILRSYPVYILPSSKENVGVIKSFSLLLEYALQNTTSDFFMFCDQDDIWKKDKIEKMLLKIKESGYTQISKPVLIHSDLEIVNSNLNTIHRSFFQYNKLNPTKNRLNYLLMQNIITGCSLMINRELAQIAAPIPNSAIMHDWWLGLVACKFGRIICLNESLVKYRQHNNNTIGVQKLTLGYLFDILFQKNFLRNNILQAKAYLDIYRDKLDIEDIEMLEDFIALEKESFFKRREILWKYGLFKQGILRNIVLFIKV